MSMSVCMGFGRMLVSFYSSLVELDRVDSFVTLKFFVSSVCPAQLDRRVYADSGYLC